MPFKTSTKLTTIKDMVESYKDLKLSIEKADAEYEAKVAPLKEMREALKQAIVNSFKKTGLPSIRTSDDYLCSYKKETEVVITNDLFAYKWALNNKAVRIDKRIADQIIKEMKEVPQGFDKVDKYTISLTKKKTKEEKHE